LSRVLVFRPEEVAGAVRRYERVHWGERGGRRTKLIAYPDPTYEVPTELGELMSVVYRTNKRGDGLSDYEHEFEGPRPVLAFSRAGLLIGGGAYVVTTHGIEG
jgi:hypothetical protein